MPIERQTATIGHFVKFLTDTQLAIYDPLVSGSRKATHMKLYVPFCLANREFIESEYGIAWKEGVHPGQKGPFFREFSDNILREGLRAYHAKQLGKAIDDAPVVLYDEKKQTVSKNGKVGTRGILHWRINENSEMNVTVTTEPPTVTTEPNPPPTVTTEPNPPPTVATEPNPPPTVATEPNPPPTVTTEPNPPPTVTMEPDPAVTVRHTCEKRAVESIESTRRQYRRKSA
jgi:hypothetical protein